MAVSVRIEDEAFADARFDVLGGLMGYSKYEALGRMAHLWRACTQRGRHVVSIALVNAILGPGGHEALASAELGELVGGGVRVCGTRGRIEWLAEKRATASAGGVARAALAAADGGRAGGKFTKRVSQIAKSAALAPATQGSTSAPPAGAGEGAPAPASAPAPVPATAPVKKDPNTVPWQEPGAPDQSTALVASRDHRRGMTRAEVEDRVGNGVAFAPKHLRKLDSMRPILPHELEWALGEARAKDPRCGPGFVLAILERGRREAAEQTAGAGPPMPLVATLTRKDRELAAVMQATDGEMFNEFKKGGGV